ncbi:MAG: hypothetical protein JKX83_04045 [Pseudomonadales bacterium]|nr:hypothetical protein [Pseudomonadales bacterium]
MTSPFFQRLIKDKFALTVYYPHEQDLALVKWTLVNLDPKLGKIVATSPVIQDRVKYSVLAFTSELDARKFKNWAAEQNFKVKKFEEEDYIGT